MDSAREIAGHFRASADIVETIGYDDVAKVYRMAATIVNSLQDEIDALWTYIRAMP